MWECSGSLNEHHIDCSYHQVASSFVKIMQGRGNLVGSIYSQALEGKPSVPKVCLFGRNNLPT